MEFVAWVCVGLWVVICAAEVGVTSLFWAAEHALNTRQPVPKWH